MDARTPMFVAVNRLPLKARRRALFAIHNRRLPQLRNPVAFNDKVNWRILHDRRPLLEWTCDKLAMKDRASAISGIRVPRTLWAGTDLQELASAVLPERWILKPNHRTGCVYFGQGQPDIGELSAVTAPWLRPDEYRRLGEWAYSKARPMLLAEEVIGEPGSPPPDYKFFVFDGEVAAVQVDVSRHTQHQRRVYLPNWTPLNVEYGPYPLPPPEPAPASLNRMLALAAELGSGFDFIRVDLYNVNGSVYFGEFTPYPTSGFDRFDPASFDTELGTKWKLPQ
jgi:hypothetical protein